MSTDSDITFITGNQKKAEYLEQHLGYPVEHMKLDLDEIQSLDLKEVVEHKVRQAYGEIKKPVIVEDVALEFMAFGRLPGPFIKYFVDEMSFEDICGMLHGQDRAAVARCVFGYYDGKNVELFEGSLGGKIAEQPAGDGGFGWDKIFIPDGYDVTRAELSEKDDRKTYLLIKPFATVKAFLEGRE
ncbi:non-canonical purine NTP pyrophosphatase [Patescibacteria group bacterium]|nr:non-canonical purine NTP pyrophosphatase [Patescibacteria group bacterium]